MASFDTFDAAQPIRCLLQHLQRGDRHKAMEQLVLLGLELGIAAEPLSPPDLQTVSQDAVNAVIRELTGLIGQQRDVAAHLTTGGPCSVAPVFEHNITQLQAVSDALAALCENRGFLVVQD